MKKKRIMSAVLALFVLSSPLSSLPTSAANTEVSAEVELEAAVDITEEECDINISQDIVIKQEIKISTVPQISDYDAVVYSANNYIPGSYWKPLMEDVPNLEAWVMKNGSYDSAYTGFYDLDNTEPYKPENWVSRECEIMGYDALVSSEYVRDGKYHALLIDEDSVSRADAIMLLYKALGEYEYDYTITNKSDKGVWVFVSRSNNANYIKRATQDYIVNVYDNNNVPIKAGDFIITAARLMQQYGEPVMNDTETNLLLQVYGEEVPIGYGADVTNAYCYLKARGVLNVEMDMTANLTLEDALNICMCIKDVNSRTDYKEIQITYDLSDALVSKGYYQRQIDVGSPDVEIGMVYDYEASGYFDYFLKINDVFTGFKDEDGNDMWKVFVSDTIETNTGQYPGAYTKSMYTSSTGDRYYHFIVPVDYPYSVVTINTVDGSDEPEWINLPRGGGIYEVKTKNSSSVNWTATAEQKSFDEMNNDEWESYNDLVRSGKTLAKAVDEYKWYDNLLALFKPMVVNAASAETLSGSTWSTFYNSTNATITIKVSHPVPTMFTDSVCKEGSKLYDEVNRIVTYLNENKDFRDSHSFGSQKVGITNVTNPTGNGFVVYTLGIESGALNFSQINNGYEYLLTEDNVNKAHSAVIKDIQAEKKAAIDSSHDEAVEKYRQHVDVSITNDVFSTSAICSKNLTNVLISYNDLVNKGLFKSGSTPQTEDGVLILYSSMNAIVKLNQKDHTIMVGSTIYKLTDDCAMFYYENSNDLYIDFRAVYGWGSSKKVYFEQNGTNVQLRTSDTIESSKYSVYSFPYVGGESNQVSYSSLMLNSNSDSFTPNHRKLLLTSAIPYANWVVFEYYDESSAKTKAYISVYYSAYIWEVGNIPGLCSKQSMEEATAESIKIQTSALGYSVFKDGEWYIRTWDLTDTMDNDDAGKIGFNRRSGLFYNIPKVHEYSHLKYLNGEYVLPFYSYIKDGAVTDVVVNTNINGNWVNNYGNGIQLKDGYLFTYAYGQVCNVVANYDSIDTVSGFEYDVYSYNVFDITEDNPNGAGTSGVFLSSTDNTLGNFKQQCLAPAAVYAYFGGFPKEYVSTNDIQSYKNAVYYLGARNVTVKDNSSFSKYVSFKYLGATVSVSKSADLKFYKVADDGYTSVYVFMGDTANLSVDLDEKQDDVVEVLDADTTKQFKGWDQFGMDYLLHSVDSGLTWLIVFIFKVLPILMMCAVTILLGLSFISQTRIVVLFSEKVIDLVHILTFGRATMKEWTFRRGFWFMLIAYIAIALLFNGNFISICAWMVSWYQELVDFIKAYR